MENNNTPNSDDQKFLFELKNKKAGEVKVGEIVFIYDWLNNRHTEILESLKAYHSKEDPNYQEVVKSFITHHAWLVIKKLSESIVLYPLSKGKFQKRLFIGLSREVISTGKIIKGSKN
jgi:hypothetical protein